MQQNTHKKGKIILFLFLASTKSPLLTMSLSENPLKRGSSFLQVFNVSRNHKMINFSYSIKYILYVLYRTEYFPCLAVFSLRLRKKLMT